MAIVNEFTVFTRRYFTISYLEMPKSRAVVLHHVQVEGVLSPHCVAANRIDFP
jgi:hypothetical protein